MEQRLKRRFQAVSLQPAAAVKMVIHRYKTYAEERKYPGYVIPHFQVITPETGKVFYQDALDIPASGLFQHFPDSRAFKIFPLQPSSQNSRMSALSSSGVRLMNADRRLRWFAMLSDSNFVECPVSESSLEIRRYMAAVSLVETVPAPAAPVLSAFIMMCVPFLFQSLRKLPELILPSETDGNAFICMDLNA